MNIHANTNTQWKRIFQFNFIHFIHKRRHKIIKQYALPRASVYWYITTNVYVNLLYTAFCKELFNFIEKFRI